MTVECIKYRSHNSGSLQGFADFFLPKVGIEIYGCTVHMKDGKRWLNLPSREYKDRDTGETKYSSIVRFPNKQHYSKFLELALQAVDTWCAENHQDASSSSNDQWQNDCPF